MPTIAVPGKPSYPGKSLSSSSDPFLCVECPLCALTSEESKSDVSYNLLPFCTALLVIYILFVLFSPFVNFVPTSPTFWLHCTFFQSRSKTYCFCIPDPSTQRVVPTPATLASPGSLLEMLVRKLGSTPGLLNWNLHFTKIPRWFLCTFKLRSTILKQLLIVLGCTLKQMGNKDGPFRRTPGHYGCQSLKAGHHFLGGGLHHGPGCSHHLTCGDTLLPGLEHWVVLGPHLPAWEAQWPPQEKEFLLLLRNSGLKSPEEDLGQEDGGNLMKKGLLQDRTKRAAQMCQWTFPAVLEITCAA